MHSIPNTGEFNNLVLELLQEMDQETGTYSGHDAAAYPNYPVGLWWYSEHRWPGKKPFRTEVAWTGRLTELFCERGVSAKTECNYGNITGRCDVVVDVGWERPIWLEVKGSWPWQFDTERSNTSYRKWLRSAAGDIKRKLAGLNAECASAIAFALIGFDQPNKGRIITDEDISEIRDIVASDGWTSAYRQWDVNMSLCFRTRCWIWTYRLTS